MGIDNAAAQMILLMRTDTTVDFYKTLTYGHQRNYISTKFQKKIAKELGIDRDQIATPYSDGLLRALGATELATLDFSDYEKATLIHDLNTPVPDVLRGTFSVVMDIGTTEHVFNVTQAHQNTKDLCQVGGHILIVNPANNYLGHGFYQFSPELIFRTYSSEEGFSILDLFLIKKGLLRNSWYRLNDPKNMRRRGDIRTAKRCYVAAIVHKLSSETTESNPQQSDYVASWNSSQISKYGAVYLRLPLPFRKVLDVTLMSLISRYRNRLTPIRFRWQNGYLGTAKNRG